MIGQILKDRYKITSLLGEGGMGEVYLATDQQTGQPVAVKILAVHLRANSEMLQRFQREAKTLRQLDHPNIVKFVDGFEHEGQFVIVMEYVSGGSLHDLLGKGHLPIERVRKIALGLCDALIRSHQLNIIHRDIKPENVLMDETGSPKLADFGVARLNEGTRMTRTGTKVGTPHYMSPEAWEGKTLDAQSDIWSLGVMLYEMLSGKVPFDGDTEPAVMTKIFNSQPPDLIKFRKDAPFGLVKTIEQMLAREKKYRYQTMREVAVDLERGQQSATPNAVRKARVRYSLPALIVILIGIVSIIWLASTRNFLGVQEVQSFLSQTVTVISTKTITPTLTPKPTASFTPTPSLTPTPYFRAENIADLVIVRQFGKHANSVAFSLDGASIVAGGALDNIVRVWDVETGELLQEFIGHSDAVQTVTFSPLGGLVASGSQDSTIRIWDLSTQKESVSIIDDVSLFNMGIEDVAFSQDGTLIAWSPLLSPANTILSRVEDGRLIRKLDGGFLAFSPDGSRVLTTLGNKAAQLLEIDDGTFVFSLEGHTDWVRSAAFSKDGKFIVTAGSNDRRLALWDASDGSLLNSFVGGYAGFADKVTFSLDGNLIVSGGWDRGSTTFWDTSGNLLYTISAGDCFDFSPDGKLFATCIGGEIQLWTIP